MENLKLFYEVAENPFDYAGKWKREHGRKAIGYFCSYAPEEVIHAAGALGFRIYNTGSRITLADAHLQAYSCSLVRGALEDALSGRLDFLDGVVFPHTCDSIQRLSDIWRINIRMGLHADVVMPVKLNTQSAREYMTDVIGKFRDDLEQNLDVEISDHALTESCATYNRIRNCLHKIYDIRRENPDAVSGRDVNAVMKSAMIMDRDVLLEKLLHVIPELEEKTAEKKSNRKRLVLSGGICNMPDVYGVIENSGGAVVWDDLCTGSRYFGGSIIDTDGDIVASIANRYLDRIVCPAKHSGLRSRGEQLVDAVKESRADGVIFMILKFCDPHAFDYPYLKDMLEKENIPSLLVEIEDRLPAEGQVKTRIEAFLEILRN